MRLIATRGLTIGHGGAPVLHATSTFHIDGGEIVTVVGPNGSGKSTLLAALLGGLAARWRGGSSAMPGLRIGYVPQSLAIDAALPLTVARFLSLPHRRSDGRDRRRAGPHRCQRIAEPAAGGACPAGNGSGCCWPAR